MDDRIPINSKVELKPGMESVYQDAAPGAQGYIRDHKTDADGFELVLVEWEKNHWKYAGQPDGWTFASHFEVIGEPDGEYRNVEGHLADLDELLDPEAETVSFEDKLTSPDDYLQELNRAMEDMMDTEAFIIIAISEQEHPDTNETVYIPRIFSSALKEEARLLLDAQLAQIASFSHQELIIRLLEMVMRRSQ